MKKESTPTIGILAKRIGPNSLGVTHPYYQMFYPFGNIKIINFEGDPNHLEDLDLLVLPGGPDINPARYGYIPSLLTQKPDLLLEHFDMTFLGRYIDAGTPIFGICRGFQTLAVHFGGILIQDMYHETSDSDERYKKVHEISINPQILHNLEIGDKKKKYEVNSLHHQCMTIADMPDCLYAIANYKGLYQEAVEAFVHKTWPIVGVQYHPEELTSDLLSDFLVTYLLKTKTTPYKLIKDKIKLNSEIL